MKTDIHIFSPGVQTSAQGVTREFTKSDLAQVAESYNSEVHEAPIRIGHEDNDKVPSWGWVKHVKMKGDDLYAEVEFSPLMEDYVKNGLYKKVSASFYAPESKINPDPGQWSLRHVAMLGAQPPAVKGLKGFAYAEESSDEGVLDFAVEMKLSPDQVFDEELGPTLTVDQQPMEFLKDQLEEARQQMAEEKKRQAEAEETLDATAELDTEERPDSDFAEEEGMKKKPSKAKQGAEDVDEEEEGEDTLDNQEATFDPAKKKRGHDGDKSSDVGMKEDSKYEESDEAEHKEKKLDPVGKEDGDIDNDGDKDESDEYLANRRKAIKKAIKADASDNGEMKYGDCMGAKKYMEKYDDAKHGDMKKYMEKYSDKEEMKKYMELAKKDGKMNYSEEDTVDHKSCGDHMEKDDAMPKGVKKYKEKDNGEGHDKNYGEVTVPDGVDSTQWEAGFKDGVDKFYAAAEAGEDEAVHEEAEDQTEDYLAGVEAGFEFAQGKLAHLKDTGFGVDRTGKGPDTHKPDDRAGKGEGDGRDEKGKGKEEERDRKATDGGAQEADRKKKGTGKDVQLPDDSLKKPAGGAPGSGKQIKGKGVRVLKFAEADFAELTERLEALEAMNAKLVAEKAAAERRAHRMQLEDFAESLYASGRLTNGMIEQEELVDYMEGLENGTLEFAEGETAATKLMEILASLPQQVEFSEVAPHDPEAVPLENLDPHERALRMSKEEGMSYTEALKQTLFSAE